MRKLLAGLLAVLLLSGCTASIQLPAEPSARSRPYIDSAPAVSDKQITIQGTALNRCYMSNEIIFISLDDFTEITHISTSLNTDGTFTCKYRHIKNELSFTSGSLYMYYAGNRYILPSSTRYDSEQWYVPAEALLTNCGYTQYYDAENDHLYYTLLTDPEKLPTGYNIPCLMYHAVSDDIWGIRELFVSPKELEKQLVYLRDNGYTAITFEDLPRIADIEKPVLLTFDDGYDDNYFNLYPLLKKYNQKATVFCIGNSFGSPRMLTEAQMKEMSDSGLVSIQSHTMTHPDLDTLDDDSQRWELSQSQLELLRVTGKQPFVLCYPTGRYNSATIALTKEYYTYGILMSGGSLVTGKNPFYIGRRYMRRSTSIATFAAYLSY